MKLLNMIRKYEKVRDAFGFVIIGAFFSLIGFVALLKEKEGSAFPLALSVLGLAALVYGILQMKKEISRSSDDYNQLNRIDESKIDPEKRREVENSTEEMEEYVFHYTGNLNQSYVMKDKNDQNVFMAACEKIVLIGDTRYTFLNYVTKTKTDKMISHTITEQLTNNAFLLTIPISSSFTIDQTNCWQYLADMGYGCEPNRKGLTASFVIRRYGVVIGEATMAGTEVIKFSLNPLSKVPVNGIFRISCRPSDIEGVFTFCFVLSKCELLG